MWGKIIIPMYRLWLNGLYGLYGPRCPLFSKRPINLISLSLSVNVWNWKIKVINPVGPMRWGGCVLLISPWEIYMKFLMNHFQANVSHYWLRYLKWTCPQMNVTGLYWWYINIGSGNSLVPSGNKPLPEPMLTQIRVANVITRPQWVNQTLLCDKGTAWATSVVMRSHGHFFEEQMLTDLSPGTWSFDLLDWLT